MHVSNLFNQLNVQGHCRQQRSSQRLKLGGASCSAKHAGGQPTSANILPAMRRDEASYFSFLRAIILTETMHGAALKCPSVPHEDFSPKL